MDLGEVSKDALTFYVRSHFPVLNTRAAQQRGFRCRVCLWLDMVRTRSRRQCDVISGFVGINDEDVGVVHLVSLAERDPSHGGWALDLEEYVARSAAGGGIRDIPIVGDAAI